MNIEYKHSAYPTTEEMVEMLNKYGFGQPVNDRETRKNIFYILNRYYKFNSIKRKWEKI
jgi:hypothetical protein